MPYPADLIQKIVDRHGIPGEVRPMPRGGMVNEAWAIGDDHVLRIVMEGRDEECDTEATREAAIVPLVVASGVMTPRLIAHGNADDLAPRPYTIYERAVGELLGFIERPIEDFAHTYVEIGRQTHLINCTRVPQEDLPKLNAELAPKPHQWVERTLAAGAITEQEAKEALKIANALVEEGGAPPPSCLTHCDMHPWNVMVDPATTALTAILDWGDATWGDPAREFAAFPFECFPHLFRGYQEAGGTIDRAFVARLLAQSVCCVLWEIRDPEMKNFARRWWRTPQGGWLEMKERVERLLAQY